MFKHDGAKAWLAKRARVAAIASAIAMVPLAVQADVSPSAAATQPAVSQSPARPLTRIVMVGTGGGPRLHAGRGQPATIVTVDGRKYLIDAGPGVSHELATLGIQAKDIDKVFITHLHFDHFGGLLSLLGFAWVEDANKTIDIYGPPATSAFVKAGETYLTNIMNLYAAQMAPRPGVSQMVKAHDVDVVKPTVIFQDDKVRVSAVENTHFKTLPLNRRPAGANRSYSYRFDTPDRSIVFTGDTGPSDGLTELTKGADVLVSMVHDLDQILTDLKYDGTDPKLKSLVDHYRDELLSPQDVGRLATKAGVKMVILNHVSRRDDVEPVRRRFIDSVRSEFSGTVIVARDGQEL